MRERVAGEHADKRLAIYASAYRSRLIEALKANYPALYRWLGDEAFNRLGSAYVDEHPSENYSIRWFGHRLPAFVARTAPWSDHGVTAELTQFEWETSEAFDAADAAAVTVEQMVAAPAGAWPGLRFQFHASLRQLPLAWSAPALWHALTQERTVQPERTESPVVWLVWRQELQLYYRALDADEAWMLNAARNGMPFGKLCEGLCEWVDPQHVAAHAAGFLRRWVGDELIVGLSTYCLNKH